ncbi:MAG: DUF4293 family protein [Muribaculaceae bacterium]
MVIQRKQTLLLLAALILMVVFLFMPVGIVSPGGKELMSSDFLVSYIMAITSVLLIGAGIFMFRNLKRQMAMMWVIIALLAATGITVAVQASGIPGLEFQWTGTLFPDICAIILVFLSWLFMRADLRLLRSADRLR